MQAIVQGELHTSKADKENLVSNVSDDVDAVFQEGRADHVDKDGWSLGYVLFVSGALFVFWLIATFTRGKTVEEQVDVPFHADIDWPLPEIYDRFPALLKLFAGVFAGAVTAWGLYIPAFSLPLLESYTVYTTVVMKPLLVIGGVIVFSGFLIIYETARIGGRDEKMAESVIRTCEEEEYETVAVLCGDSHRDGIAEELRERGWDVETYKANSRLSNFL